MRRIVFTGPESTGKTTLASALSQLVELPLVIEYAREYLKESLEYKYEDLATIAKGQLLLQATAIEQSETIICDTDLVTIAVWALFKYQKCERWIIDACIPNEHDIFFLCGVDVPWEVDPLRENPLDRVALYDMHKRILQQNKCTVVELIGDESERLKKVLETLHSKDIAIKH